MRVLVVVTRYPWPSTKGDQQRAWSWIGALALRHSVTVVTTGRAASPAWREELGRRAEVVEVPASGVVRALDAARALVAGEPGQVGWMMPQRAWRTVCDRARAADVVLAVTVRSLRGPLTTPVVLDHVDALSLNMRRRARGPEPLPLRLAAAVEATRLRGWERRARDWVTVQIVTSAEDARALPAPPEVRVVPVGLDGEPFVEPPGHVRDIDVILSGNMRYPPNRAAARRLADGILPAVRRRRPVRAVIVGRAASTLALRGVEIASDVPDVAPYLRRARVAVAPLVGGTGTPYKVLEATAAGAALVTVPWAAERFGMDAHTAVTDDEFAEQIVALLDEDLRRVAVERARPALTAHSTPVLAQAVEAALRAAAGSAGGRAAG